MKNKVILTMVYDIKLFPPVISICNILSELNYEIVYIGGCSDPIIEKTLREKNKVRFYITPSYGGGALSRFIQQWKYRRYVLNVLKKEYKNESTYLWLLHAETVSLFAAFLGKYDVIAHLFEFKNPTDKLAYRVLSPFARFDKKLRLANKVICCEYNRAHMTKAIYCLDKLPYVLPNKPYFREEKCVSSSVANIEKIKKILVKYRHKKIILYQGIFLSERKLDDYIEALNALPDDYVMIMMGNQNRLYYQLEKKYGSEKIIFLPFLPPPLHLEVTKQAYIGILTYIPDEHTMEHAVNVLFCAPNKLYEYSKYGKPMIANDLPSLKYAFSQHKAGICVDEMQKENIMKAIESIDADYESYQKSSYDLYNSVDMFKIISNML